MPTLVYELRGSGRGIETAGTDGTLIFPNVSSCVAVVAHSGGTLVGAHVTGFDIEKLNSIRETLEGDYPGANFYVAGHLEHYNVSCFGATTHYVKVAGNVDIMVKLRGNQVTCSTRPAVGMSGATTETGFTAEQWS